MFDIIIIGAGIVGGNIAYELSKYDVNVLVLEKHNDISNAMTKANSGIVHAGYDPLEGTLMAKLNVLGSMAMELLCKKLNVPYKKTGSFVLGFDENDDKTIKTLYDRGIANGVPCLSILSKNEILKLEPNINYEVTSALYAKNAAIISPWELAIAFCEVAVTNGVTIKLNQEVTSITQNNNNNFTVTTKDDQFTGKYVINCAGINSDEINNMISSKKFTIESDRGEYFLMDKNMGDLVSSVIFTCPNEHGKGVLVSPTVHNNLIVGPTSQVIDDKEDNAVTKEMLDKIKLLAKKSVPSITFNDNIRNFSGNRPKSGYSDFIIEESDVKNFINVACIKSPGLTCSAVVGEYVINILKNIGFNTKMKNDFCDSREHIVFKNLSFDEKNKLIAQNSDYGTVICRCETITKGEIIDAINSPIPPCSLDGIKRRCNASMGRCQGGFCGPKIIDIIATEKNINKDKILLDKNGSYIILH